MELRLTSPLAGNNEVEQRCTPAITTLQRRSFLSLASQNERPQQNTSLSIKQQADSYKGFSCASVGVAFPRVARTREGCCRSQYNHLGIASKLKISIIIIEDHTSGDVT